MCAASEARTQQASPEGDVRVLRQANLQSVQRSACGKPTRGHRIRHPAYGVAMLISRARSAHKENAKASHPTRFQGTIQHTCQHWSSVCAIQRCSRWCVPPPCRCRWLRARPAPRRHKRHGPRATSRQVDSPLCFHDVDVGAVASKVQPVDWRRMGAAPRYSFLKLSVVWYYYIYSINIRFVSFLVSCFQWNFGISGFFRVWRLKKREKRRSRFGPKVGGKERKGKER